VSHDAELATQVGQTAALFRRVEGELKAAIGAIRAAGHKRVWLCGGGNVAGQLLALDCIDEVIVTVAPVALGQGPALFDAPALTERRFGLIACHALNDRTARLHWVRTRS
jgi:dihydrofolate reductase